MKERLEEAESMGVRRMKAQVQAMEGRVSSLEEQLDAATRYEEQMEERMGKPHDRTCTFFTCTYICAPLFFFYLAVFLECIAFAWLCYLCRHSDYMYRSHTGELSIYMHIVSSMDVFPPLPSPSPPLSSPPIPFPPPSLPLPSPPLPFLSPPPGNVPRLTALFAVKTRS